MDKIRYLNQALVVAGADGGRVSRLVSLEVKQELVDVDEGGPATSATKTLKNTTFSQIMSGGSRTSDLNRSHWVLQN